MAPQHEPRPDAARSAWPDRHLWQLRPIRDLFWIAAAVLLLWVGYLLRSIFTPVLIAWVLAYLFSPLIDVAERRARMSRALTISLLLTGLLLAAVGIGIWLGPMIGRQVSALIDHVPGYVKMLGERYGWDVSDLSPEVEQFRQRIAEGPGDSLGPLLSGTSRAFGFIGSVIGTTVYVIVTAVLIPIYFFFFAKYFHPMVRNLARYVPDSRRDRVLDIAGKMDRAVSAFFRGRVIIALIMGVMFVAGWCPWLTDVPYWLVLGLATGLLSLIPYAAGIGWLAAVGLKAVEMASGGELTAWQWVLGLGGPTLVYAVVQAIEGWFLTPYIQGKTMDLHAVTVLIVVFVGGALGGLYGLILAIPLAACVKILLREVFLPHLADWARDH